MQGPPVHPRSLSPIAALPPSYRCMSAHCMRSPSPAPGLLGGWEVNAAAAGASEPGHGAVAGVCTAVPLPEGGTEAGSPALCVLPRWEMFLLFQLNHSRVSKSALGAARCVTRGPCPASLPTRLRGICTSTDVRLGHRRASTRVAASPEGHRHAPARLCCLLLP